MAVTLVDSPLATMVEPTPTDYWNDSCSLDEVAYAVDAGPPGRRRTRSSSARS